MRRILLATALVVPAVVGVAVALAGHGSERATPRQLGQLGDPGVFVKQLVVQIVRDDYERAWQTLHPAHKQVASEWEYVDCELTAPMPGKLVSVKVLRVFDKPVFVPGLWRVVESKAVTFRLTLREPLLEETAVVTHTGHAVAVDGRWTWILPDERFEVYRSNSCVGGGPTA
jgi:hypothetical protein